MGSFYVNFFSIRILWRFVDVTVTKGSNSKIEMDSLKRDESEKLRDFENSFFNMLSILQTLIKDMRVENSSGRKLAEGRHVFLYFYKNFKKEVRQKNGRRLDF